MSKWLLSVAVLSLALLCAHGVSSVAQPPPENAFPNGELKIGETYSFVRTGGNYIDGTKGKVIAINNGWVKVAIKLGGFSSEAWINLQNVGAIHLADTMKYEKSPNAD